MAARAAFRVSVRFIDNEPAAALGVALGAIGLIGALFPKWEENRSGLLEAHYKPIPTIPALAESVEKKEALDPARIRSGLSLVDWSIGAEESASV
eukprot:PLAT6207.1.p2 GENE.PLAT6207.1~~PLAT6207.1.p2  ORF type:complete len:107 (+),score=14.41 PLAT6207.1:39-323(+)